jgi:hypothetical protein
MKKSLLLGVSLVLFSFLFHASATVRYVDAGNTNPVPPYTSWATAATNIQDAAQAAFNDDTILVTNGVYQYGGTSFNGSNRVRVVGSVLLKSVNGPAVTTIVGYQMPGTTNGSSAIRCVYLSEFAALSGFTLTNGATVTITSGFGGGVVMESSCWVSNCIIVNNGAQNQGGGCYSGNGSPIIDSWISGNTALTGGGVYGAGFAPVVNCIVTNNSAPNGSGVANCNVYDSLLTGNGQTAHSGSAAYFSTLVNCTVAGNYSIGFGAANGCRLANSIVYYNSNGAYADCYQCNLTNSCTTIGIGNTGPLINGSISNAPGFVNPAGDYHLNGWSHCIGAGNTAYVTNSTDLDENPRIVNGAVDMGCYENQSPFQGAAHYVSLLSTNPSPPYTNWVTAATNIQDAVAVAQTGEYVIVDDGVYTNAGAVVYGAETNRVALTNGITLLSTGGSQAAQIVGAPQTRCAYVGPNSVLTGFTLTGGQAFSGDITNEQSGGGAWCAAGGVISNCFIVGNRANGTTGRGGGVYGGAIYNSIITNNNYGYGAVASAALYNCTVISNGWLSGSQYAGGLYYGTASNCLIAANRAYSGGAGVYHATVWNSAIVANQSSGGPGAGAYQSQLYGCSILTNSAASFGGGAYQSVLSNCVVSGNSNTGAYQSTNYNCIFSGNYGSDGGGVNSGISYDCTFIGNSSFFGGGGQNATFYDCLLVSNTANQGGGAYNGILYNCTVVGNTATNTGGGVFATGGSINNSIVYYNTASTGPNWTGAKFNYSCTTPAAVGGPTSSITNAPIFLNMAAGDFHEQTNSATINDGSNSYATNTDLEGNPRIVGGTVDIGAYEYQGSNYNLPIPIQWLIQYGLPTDGSQNYAYSDNSGMNNWQKWIAGLVPTNSASVLAMVSPAPTNNSSGIIVTWRSVTNRTYFLQSSTNLTGQPAFWSIQSNIPGRPGTTSYTDTSATNVGPYFYRVGVQ